MSTTTLKDTALVPVAPGKGILAADESHATIGRRFETLGIPNSQEQRRRYAAPHLRLPLLSK
jgi:fructose-bisphosphate aldolase class I